MVYHGAVLEEVRSVTVCWVEMHLQRNLWKELKAWGPEQRDELLYQYGHGRKVKLLHSGQNKGT